MKLITQAAVGDDLACDARMTEPTRTYIENDTRYCYMLAPSASADRATGPLRDRGAR